MKKVIAYTPTEIFYEKDGKCYFCKALNANPADIQAIIGSSNNELLTIENAPVTTPKEVAFKYLSNQN